MHTQLLNAVGALSQLISLESNLRFADGALFRRLSALQELVLYESGFCNLEFLESLKVLETFKIFIPGPCHYTAIENCPSLKEIAIYGGGTTDNTPDFSKLPLLEKVTLTSRTPRRLIRRLSQAPLNKLKINLNRGDLEILRGVPTLTNLTLCSPVRGNHRLASLSRLERLTIEEICTTDLSFTKSLPRLHSLTLGSERKGPFDLRRLTRSLRNLRLKIPMSRLTGESCLRRFEHLNTIELWHASVGDLSVLEKCASLEELRLIEPDFDIGPFPDIPGLRFLTIYGGEGELPECVLRRKALEVLHLSTPGIDPGPLAEMTRLKWLRFHPGPGESFDFLRNLPELGYLGICSDAVDLSKIPIGKGVRRLSLNGSCIHIDALANWPSLEELEIQVGEEGLKPFAALTNLKGLSLQWEDPDDVPQTEEACEPLSRWTHLDWLRLWIEH